MPISGHNPVTAHRAQFLAGLAVLLLTIACVGVVTYRHGSRPVWNDEAWVVEYAARPTVAQTLRDDLAARQPAAPGYLALLHGVARLDSGALWKFRIPSAVAAIVLLIAAGILIGCCAGSYALGQGLALFLLASPLLQRYAGEVKQYLLEAALSLLLLVLMDAWLASSRRTGAAGWTWFGVAILTLVSTFAGWFGVAATMLVLIGASLPRCHRARLRLLLPMAGVLCAEALTLYLLFLRPLTQSPLLRDFWSDSYSPHDRTLPRQLWDLGLSYFNQAWYLYHAPARLMLPAAALGWCIWLARAPAVALAAAATVALTILTSIAGCWPDGVRINLALVVILHLCVLIGVAGVLRGACAVVGGLISLRPSSASEGTGGTIGRRIPWLALVTVVLAGAAATITVHVTREADFSVADVGPLLDQLAARVQPGQVVIADQTADVNLCFHRPALAIKLIEITGTPPENIGPLAGDGSGAPVLIAIGHHNAATSAHWRAFLNATGDSGGCAVIEPIWSGHLVALYRFLRTPDAVPSMHAAVGAQ
jgi:hypothetical protein